MASIGSQKSPLSILSLAREGRWRDRAWPGGQRGADRDPVTGAQPESSFGKRPVKLLFDVFEFRVDSGELRRDGEVIRIQPQPARVLEALARRAGEVVSRQELQGLVWGEETHVADRDLGRRDACRIDLGDDLPAGFDHIEQTVG